MKKVTKISKKKLISSYEKDIAILKNDLLTYGKKNKKVAEYDKKQISKYELEIEKLKKGANHEKRRNTKKI